MPKQIELLVDEESGREWLGDLAQLPRPIKKWERLGPTHGPEYRCADLPGIVIRHCGHPTAHRPYFFEGIATPRKVKLLADAKAIAEAVAARLITVDVLG